ncbi:cobalt-precorrin-6A reductase [Devosia sp. XJ19-1]|uniref:Cobalt-precorrin-6A reductase n=1 Tax=Devosia ureilytica TaxID=2952754 RepID=A0A9Q4FSH3_9HYPH|nr:cobalt-precorrin-6A reductase [Devosia ureilytica]MCP8884913.1 cobalt-precorrin-6A reductase [Devosia ureilytica]MCP8888576.1 cobalt-precorrin-6A reductase [Devosia ureilytica]
MKILILGGTAEARQVANRLVAMGHDVTTSLAGRTQDPILPEGGLRMGPFGGIPGLCAYLRAARIERLVDATHPYAGLISINAVAASETTGIRLVRYMRPAWVPVPGQSWITVGTAREAADALPKMANVLLTTGHAGLEAFLERSDCSIYVRVIEPPDFALPRHAELIVSRPPYGLEQELALLRRHDITHLVSKNSGGGQTAAKLEAAQRMGVQVIMIARPVYGPALEVASVDDALAALELPAP